MRPSLLLLLGLGIFALPVATPSASAADLSVTQTKKVVRVVHRKRVVHRGIVRDYDGTAILIRPRGPVVVRDYYGTRVVMNTSTTTPVIGANPLYYLNGQRVPAGGR